MAKTYGVKDKDQVVEHIINLILDGRLRTGDRIDRTELTEELGLSRIPVQEAILQLERDGIVATRYHRGAFVERFDEAVIIEHHELYGMLNGIVAQRAAMNLTPRILAHLDVSRRNLRAATDPNAFQEACWSYRDVVVNEYAGPRLLAALRGSQSFVPTVFWVSYPHAKREFLPTYEAEILAIRERDPAAARAACVTRADIMARVMLAELTLRGVLGDSASD